MRKLTTLLVFLMFAGLQIVFAQRTVTGRVTDAANDTPFPGVFVVVKGTTTGVLTDVGGNFTVPVPDNRAVLQFSFIGYVTKEIAVGTQTTFDISLEQSTVQMEEIVVTSLGIKREAKSLGYSATTMNTAQIAENPSMNMGNAMMGKVAGLNVSAPPTGPGGSSKLRIRGQSSFGGYNEPLIVINGVPINNSSTFTGIGGDFGNGLQSINPDDIESMTVLKGATAAALYGYRAKDGVIMITTKSGAGRRGLGVELTSGIVFDQPIDYTDFQQEYGQGQNGLRPVSLTDARSSSSWSFGGKMDGEPVWCFDGKEHPYSPNPKPLGFYNTGITVNNTLAFSGGNENGSFHFSIADNRANAITPNSKFNKQIFDFGVDYKFGKLTLHSNANYSLEYNQNPPGSTQQFGIANTVYTTAVSSDLRWLLDMPGTSGYKDTVTGNEYTITNFSYRTNPYWTAYERFEDRSRNRIFGNILLRYDFFPWLYLQGRVGQDYFVTETEYNSPTGTAYLGAAPAGQFNGEFSITKATFSETNFDFLVGVNKKFGSFGFDAQFGGNAMNTVSQSTGTSVVNFYIRDLYTISNGVTKTPSQTYSQKKVNSLYGTISLSYNDYLFLNATGRNDWFSTLNPESNSYLYPSVGASFVFSQALDNIMPSWFTFGKLRASYAEVGGDTSPYGSSIYYSLNSNAFDGQYAWGGVSGSTVPNPDLKPLKVKEAEVGMELIFLDRRISIDVAGYNKNTVDEILNVDVSSASGYNQTKVNVGKLRNRGVEALLTFVPVETRDFSWETAFNYSYNISKVLELAGGAERIVVSSGQMWLGSQSIAHEVGMPLGSLRGNDFLRNDKGEILTSGGQFRVNSQMMTYGSIIPKHVGGWLNTFTYKMFSLFAQFDFKAGHKLLSQSNYNAMRAGFHKETLVGREAPGVVFDGVVDNDANVSTSEDDTPNTTAVPAQTFYTNYASVKPYTPFIYNASFIKWRTLALNADLTKFVGGRVIKGLNVNASVNNVLSLLKYVDNLDAECISNVDDNNGGIEQMGPPTVRSYALTLNIKF
jgi:TonB-linked SusC/RagA family outer membrane protein